MSKKTNFLTYSELEDIGIVGTYTHSGKLHAITIDRRVWRYDPTAYVFMYIDTLL